MKKKASQKPRPGKNDPLRAYRFSGALRHILSALYGIVLGYALMSGNEVVNFFATVLTAIFIYVVLKTLSGKLLVKITLHSESVRIYQGENVRAWATVRNRSPFIFPVSYLALPEGAAGSADNDPRLFFFLKPFSKQHISLPVSFRHCGRYCLRLESTRLMSAGGLVNVIKKPPKKALPEVAVLPAPLSLDIRFNSDFSTDSGVATTKTSTEPTDSSYLRQYVPGDDPRFIHWKRSATREDWLIRGFYLDDRSRCTVYFDALQPGGLHRDLRAETDPFELQAEAEADYARADALSRAVLGVGRTLLARGCAFNFIYPAVDAEGRLEYAVAECEDELAFRRIEELAGTMDLADTAALPPEERPAVTAATASGTSMPGNAPTDAASIAAANAELLRPGWLKLATPGDPIVAVTASHASPGLSAAASDAFRAEYGFTLMFRNERASGSEIVIAEVSV
ncbi:MAG: DUF58 domain-containing protein [Clostridia bacterium]|nr:DUF58 domain-containing protein [Clostridia bacterium]